MDLLNTMEYFFTDIFESQKDLDLKVYVEASPKNIFKKRTMRAISENTRDLRTWRCRLIQRQ